jgi:predicted ATPase
VAETQPELVAHHYASAGLAAPAIGYYRRAADRAMAASANTDAIAHLTKGLELIASLPEASDRISREIDFRLSLGSLLTAMRGYGSVEAAAAYTRARELCAGAGDTPELFRSLVGLWLHHLMQPHLETTSELSRELLDLAAKLGNDEFRLIAESVACCTCFWSGRYTSVLSHAARVRVLYDQEYHRPKMYMIDPAMSALAYESLALWYLGYPERASERGLAALSMAQTAARPFGLCLALWLEAWLRILRREPELMAARTKAYVAVAREQGFAFYCAVGSMLEIWHDAWVTGQCGDDRIEAFRSSGLAELRRIGSRVALGLWHVLFAECLEKQGNTDEALMALEAALVHVECTGDAIWEPEVHRLIGDLLFQRNPSAPDQTEASYRRAIERARLQQTKSWELRAATSLARLWRDQGKPADALAPLAPVYGWFTEGFDTADLKDAKALLDHLACA